MVHPKKCETMDHVFIKLVITIQIFHFKLIKSIPLCFTLYYNTLLQLSIITNFC